MLADELAEAIAYPRAVAVSVPICVTAVAVHRLGRELARLLWFTTRLRGAGQRRQFLNRANPDPVCLAQCAVNGPGLGNAHFRAAHKNGNIGRVGIAVTREAVATLISEHSRSECPTAGVVVA